MKTLNTLITLLLLIIGSTSFASEDGSKSVKNSKVAAAPSVWESADVEIPEGLKFLKAKSAFVPIATFVWGNPSEAPVNLTMIPAAPFIYSDNDSNVPEALALVKAKSGYVRVAPFVLGDPTADIPASLSVK